MSLESDLLLKIIYRRNVLSVVHRKKFLKRLIMMITKEFISKATLSVIPACLESFRLVRNREERCWTSQHDRILICM